MSEMWEPQMTTPRADLVFGDWRQYMIRIPLHRQVVNGRTIVSRGPAAPRAHVVVELVAAGTGLSAP